MGNRIAITFGLILFACFSYAQISLDSSEFPVVGTNYALNNVAFVDIPPSAPSGPDQTYDFTGGFTYSGSLIDYANATLSPFTSEYPSSNLSRYIPGIGNGEGYEQHLFYATDVSGFWQNGMVWVGYIIDTLKIDTLFFYFDPPNEDTLLTDLYTYGYTDSTYSLSYVTIWFGPTQVDFYNHLYKTIDADGWGTMETGYGTYDSVLKVNITEYRFDSTFVGGVFDNATQEVTAYTLYYRQGVKYPLVKQIAVPFVGITGTDTTLYYITEILNIPPPPAIVTGCTDPLAINFNPLANQDDGSCIICPPISYTLTGDTSICTGQSLTLTVSGGVSYVWSTGDSISTISVSPTATSVYSVLIKSSQYCWEQATVQVIVNDDVIANFWNATPNNTDSTTFVNLSANATDFIWDFGDGTTSTEASPKKFYDTLGAYTVMLIASNSCSVDTMITSIQVVIGVEELVGGIGELKVVPNPVIGSASVYFNLNGAAIIDLDVIDILGRVHIIKQDYRLPTGRHEIDISEEISQFAPGVYFIRLQSSEGQSFFKWIKQ